MKLDEKKIDILVAGELNMDLILAGIKEFPALGKEILADEMTLTLGSSSAIFASNISVLGFRVCFAGMVGKDQFGEQIIQSLVGKNVDTSQVICSDKYRSGLTVSFSFENQKAAVTYPGAMEEFSEKDISNEILENSKHLHVSSVFMQPELKKGIVNLFRRAKEAGLSTSLDTQWDPDEKWDCDWENLLPLVDLFLPNLDEAKCITKQSTPELCIESLKKVAKTIVIKCGTDGSIAWDGKSFTRQTAYLNRNVRDTIGAGDSFNAGFIYKFLQNEPLKACLEFGAICGAINTTDYGGTTAFSTKENIKKTAIEQFNYPIYDL